MSPGEGVVPRKAEENAVSGPDTDKVFTGSIPKLYEEYLVPLIFEPYAVDLANRVASRSPARVLEIAAGTGVVTRNAGLRATGKRLHRRHGFESADAGPGFRGRDQAPCRVASGRRHATALRGRSVRRRGVPVRSHVLSRKVEGVFGGAASPQVRRRFHFQRVGPNRGERVRPHGDDRRSNLSSPRTRRASWPARPTATTTSRPLSEI